MNEAAPIVQQMFLRVHLVLQRLDLLRGIGSLRRGNAGQE